MPLSWDPFAYEKLANIEELLEQQQQDQWEREHPDGISIEYEDDPFSDLNYKVSLLPGLPFTADFNDRHANPLNAPAWKLQAIVEDFFYDGMPYQSAERLYAFAYACPPLTLHISRPLADNHPLLGNDKVRRQQWRVRARKRRFEANKKEPCLKTESELVAPVLSKDLMGLFGRTLKARHKEIAECILEKRPWFCVVERGCTTDRWANRLED